MAGSGKGRGRAAFTFNIEAIGFSKGETLPEVAFKPPPLFPSTGFKPVPLKMGEEEDYMLALKQEFRGSMKNTPYFMPSKDEKQGVEKYSKKYLQMRKESMEWTPDWRRLPREMKPRIKTKKGGKTKKAKVATPKSNVDLLKKIEELEKKGDEEKSDEEKEKEKDKEGGEEEGEEEEANEQEYDEEEHEEENDYIASYFEDGDDFGAGSDDNMDEATY
ncbi:DNA-directed RNA polymerase III subunit RPC7 isoform X2 [Pelodiscus sinensis]|uniref:DNA-directed RNA polymerase III subunit RPC7 isoform X2 n=1 Tax=Pelodiscus sinensis TaxID=13735 RepID=UPI000D72109A|nr:DNA-directed RNA polymerase III subunit RPC7 isoform X2 [Pelodiscus sinensis]|eukprot:XP_025045093.1 DNA-directed RNA polymerase III subunit RPC7 isoform X2 [Pelodiscus sinensis]